jgi:hypothetical protein
MVAEAVELVIEFAFAGRAMAMYLAAIAVSSADVTAVPRAVGL